MKIEINYDKTFSTQEIMILLDVGESTARSLIKSGKLLRGKSMSNQGAFLVEGHVLRDYMQMKGLIGKYGTTYEIPEDKVKAYLEAGIHKCMRELSAAEHVMSRERQELNGLLQELFKRGA